MQWLGEAKVLCSLHHLGIQPVLAYSWARPAILAAGKGRAGMFLFPLFLHFHSFFSVLALREVWESETPENCPGTSKTQCQEVLDSQFLKIFSHL